MYPALPIYLPPSRAFSFIQKYFLLHFAWLNSILSRVTWLKTIFSISISILCICLFKCGWSFQQQKPPVFATQPKQFRSGFARPWDGLFQQQQPHAVECGRFTGGWPQSRQPKSLPERLTAEHSFGPAGTPGRERKAKRLRKWCMNSENQRMAYTEEKTGSFLPKEEGGGGRKMKKPRHRTERRR